MNHRGENHYWQQAHEKILSWGGSCSSWWRLLDLACAEFIWEKEMKLRLLFKELFNRMYLGTSSPPWNGPCPVLPVLSASATDQKLEICSMQYIEPSFCQGMTYRSPIVKWTRNVCWFLLFRSKASVIKTNITTANITLPLPLIQSLKRHEGPSLAVQWLRLCLPMLGVRVRSLVRELRSHMPDGQKTQKTPHKTEAIL